MLIVGVGYPHISTTIHRYRQLSTSTNNISSIGSLANIDYKVSDKRVDRCTGHDIALFRLFRACAASVLATASGSVILVLCARPRRSPPGHLRCSDLVAFWSTSQASHSALVLLDGHRMRSRPRARARCASRTSCKPSSAYSFGLVS